MKSKVKNTGAEMSLIGDFRATRAFPSPPSIPHHTLLGRIGSGSYGDVWLGRNSMGIYRAIKIVYRDSFSDERPFQRELAGIRKFEPISRSHNGFIDILHFGMDDQQSHFFYIMELADDCASGQKIIPESYIALTLDRAIASRGRIPVQECLEIGVALSNAVHALHKHGLVHRDIKPSNILFVEGIPKLADIGNVANLDDTRSFVGTDGFVPPEGPGRPQADVYGLGRVLYEAATGRDRYSFPELPPGFKDFPDQRGFLELNEVFMKACERDAAKRYQSAALMEADLLLLVNGQSILRLRELEKLLIAGKRIGIAILVATAIAAIIAYPLYVQYKERENTAQREAGAAIAYGNTFMDSGDLLGALPFLTEALRIHSGRHMNDSSDRIRVGATLAQCPKLTHSWFEASEVNDCEFSPDGNRVVIAFETGSLKVCNLGDDTQSAPFGNQIVLNQPALATTAVSLLREAMMILPPYSRQQR